tara:strand:- start:15 stop:308 length:294 start_codon:yes stop_codon:yes gene_type:complete
MSSLLQEIINAVNTEIVPAVPKMSSERKRIEMRVKLSALEKMIKHIRMELLKESKEIKNNRKKRNNINLKNNISNNIAEVQVEEQNVREKEDSQEEK